MNYGTGAVMAVPMHDDRDREFAEKYHLEIVDRPLVDSIAITKKVGGKLVTKYKMRDAIFARQRYWGEPIPLVFCEHCKEYGTKNKEQMSQGELLNPGWIPLPEDQLPLELPKVEKSGMLESIQCSCLS